MAVLAVREYQRIACGATFDPSSRTVSPLQRQRLERFNEEYRRRFGAKVLDYGPRQSLVTQNFVGVIDIGGHQVEVLPKIEGAQENEVRQNLAEMIAVALDLEIHTGGVSAMKQPAPTLLEILIRLFCSHLWSAVHRGIVRRYEAQSDDLTVLRGRLDVARQVRRHFARQDLLACHFDEFSEDNALNQVLKAALVTLLGSVRTAANERSISDLLLCFQDVADVPTPQLRWHHASVDRLTIRYRPLLQMAKLFIEGRAPDVVSGRGYGFALLFDMNELFEKYVGRIVKRMAIGSPVRISLQGPTAFLARREGAGQAFKLIPDIVAREAGRVKWIADTKWKRLDATQNRDGLSSADMYQMHAYARRYQTEDVVLIYPHHAELGPWKAHRDRYYLADEGIERKVAVATVDLRDLRSVPAQLKEILWGAWSLPVGVIPL